MVTLINIRNDWAKNNKKPKKRKTVTQPCCITSATRLEARPSFPSLSCCEGSDIACLTEAAPELPELSRW